MQTGDETTLEDAQLKSQLEKRLGITIHPFHPLECSCNETTLGKYVGIQSSPNPSEETVLYTCSNCGTTKSIRPSKLYNEQYSEGIRLEELA